MHLSIYFFSALRSEKVTISTANKLLVKMGRAKINYFWGKSKQYCIVRWKLRAFNAFISPLGVLGYCGCIALPSMHIINVLCSLKGMCYVETTCVFLIVATQRRIVVPGAATPCIWCNTTVAFALQSMLYVATCCRCLVSCKLEDRENISSWIVCMSYHVSSLVRPSLVLTFNAWVFFRYIIYKCRMMINSGIFILPKAW